MQKELRLGNLDAKRDWGFAPEYVNAMWLMMQQKIPDDFVIATGETHSVREFVEAAFSAAGLDWKRYVITDQKLKRPLDVHQLCGDNAKAQKVLGWKPSVTFNELVKIMVEEDLRRWQMYKDGKIVPWDAPNYPHEMDMISRNVVRDAQKENSVRKKSRLKRLLNRF